MSLSLSFIIPVYNRPDEVRELLESFRQQTYTVDYEIVLVEDGSTIDSREVVSQFSDLPVVYFYKENSGPGPSRNYGMAKAMGNYFIILDSDCLLPPQYLEIVIKSLETSYIDFFGGPDAAHKDFSLLQKAINYSMTSVLTTGGIRGNKASGSSFQPRSFNKKFYQQVRKFGLVRPILNSWHPKTAKVTYWFPALFLCFAIFSLFTAVFGYFLPIFLVLIYLLLIFFHSSFKNKSLIIGVYSVFATLVQFIGYGLGFLESTFAVNWLKKLPQKRFPHLFFD